MAAFSGSGVPYGFNLTYDSAGGLSVATGDVDSDGSAEVVIGLDAGVTNRPRVRIYKATGELLGSFDAFQPKKYSGAKVSLGSIGY